MAILLITAPCVSLIPTPFLPTLKLITFSLVLFSPPSSSNLTEVVSFFLAFSKLLLENELLLLVESDRSSLESMAYFTLSSTIKSA